jgi:hypothetical protein
MANGWTPERRARQAELIRRWRPWERSTGPKTPDGKRRSAVRGYKGAARPTLRLLAKVLREQRRLVS